MDKKIDLNKSVYDLTHEFPEIIDVLKNLGFTDIVKPGMLQTAGRFMTLTKGASMKKIDLNLIKQTLYDNGFTIIE